MARQSSQPQGRLELTWTNKHKTLLSHEDGSYEWVEPADYRVSEVRTLHDVTTVGEVGPERAADNLLIRGDALHALQSLNRVPEFAKEYAGKVRLCYIDPPFNTGQAFEQYDDNLEHSVWLTMLRDRLVQIKPLLAPNGSVWVHLDDAEVHRCRVVLDEVLGAENYLATVVWQRTSAKSLARRTMGTMHESILVYGRSEAAELRTVYLPLEEAYLKRYSQEDGRGAYDTGDLTAGSHRPHLDSGLPWRGFDPSAIKRCWAVPRKPLVEAGLTDGQLAEMTMREKLDALDAAGYIHWPTKGGFPRFKKYLHNTKGRAMGNLWTDVNVINSQAVERTGFSTQKPEALVERILTMGSEPGDIVLDCFAGSGTTAAVAHKMRRRWVAVEWSADTIATFTLPRLTKIVAGEDPGGVTSVATPTGEGLPDGVRAGESKSAAKVLDVMSKAGALDDIDGFDENTRNALTQALRLADTTTKETIWDGGGGFRVLEVGPSMFVEVDGRVYLADWATNGALAEAVAAQLGYAYEDDAPFSGSKGRTRLAVVDGLVNDGVIRTLVSLLDDDQRLCVAGTAIDPDARHALRELRPGSTVRKVPAALLDEYRQSRSERLRLLSTLNGEGRQAANQPPAGVGAG